MRVLVVGSGSIGRRHARNALALGHEAAVARRPGTETETVGRELGVPAFAGLDAAAGWQPEAVVVATPPTAHLGAARWAVEHRLPVLVEKPLATGLDGVDALLELAAREHVHVAVGCNLRFHPALAAIDRAVADGRVGRLLAVRAEVGSYLPSWHPGDDYRTNAAARTELGGGALLTLVHELDYVLWICGPAQLVSGVRTKVSGLDVDADDLAELVLRHDSGALSSIHMDLVDRAYNRRSRWIGDEATIEWSWGGAVAIRDGSGDVLWEDDGFDLDETYVAELRAFLAAEPAPGDGVGDARRALELAAAVERL
jgi:predicted dehydrogenase